MAKNEDRGQDRGGGSFANYAGKLELDTDELPKRDDDAPEAQAPPQGAVFRQASPGSPSTALRPRSGQGEDPRRSQDPRRASQGALEISSAREPSKLIGRLILLAVFGGLGFGAYYFYCALQVNDRHRAFDVQAIELRQGLLALPGRVDRQDVIKLLKTYAQKTGLTIEHVTVSLDPLDDQSMKKLNVITQRALGIAAKIPHHRRPQCVIGFRVTLKASQGFVTKHFESKRYTWFDGVKPGACDGTPDPSTGN